MQIYLSSIAFILLIIMVGGRTLIMRCHGIRAIVFGKTDKSDFLLLSVVLLLAYSVFGQLINLPMWRPLTEPFWGTETFGWIGLALCTIALVGVAAGLISFSSSFRIGIDEERPDALITNGIFSLSRNPLYVCFFIFFLGILLIHRNPLITVAVILLTLALHRQTLREEGFMQKHYGEAYKEYRKKVPRYL